jgi:hypothetical protein
LLCIRMDVLKNFLFLFFTLVFVPGHGSDTLKVLPLKMPEVLRSAARQFSGMALRGGMIYLLPENRKDKPGADGVYSIQADEVSRVIRDTSKVMDAKYVRKYELGGAGFLHDLPGYEGLEALDIVGDKFFVTVETDTTNRYGYIAKGVILEDKFLLTGVCLPLLKPTKSDGSQYFNAGFESLKFAEGKLLCMFEHNYGEVPFAYQADTSLSLPPEKVVLSQKIPFRITDIDAIGDGLYLAMNFFFRMKAESYYAENLRSGDEKLINDVDGVPHPSYARILRLKYGSQGALESEKAWELPRMTWGINWEGIIRISENGVLIVNDLYMGKERGSCMMFVELPGIEN